MEPVTTMAQASLNVLLIEDHPSDARLVREMLAEASPQGFRLEHFERLADAVRRLEGNAFDAVLLDLSLPDVQGLDAVRQMQAVDPAVPIVVLSGCDDEALAVEALQAGAQDYLVKGRGDGDLLARCLRYAIERKRAEEALRESEVRLAKAAELAKVGYWVWDEIEDRALYCSDELAQICGFATGHELTAVLSSSDKDLEWVHPADRARFAEVIRQSKAEKNTYDVEYRMVRPDGQIRHLREILEPVLDDRGNLVRSNGVIQDITDRKQAQEALRESEARLAKAAKMAKVGYWVWDEIEDKAVYCSDELAEITGVATGRELTAMLTSFEKDMEWVHPDDSDHVVKVARECITEQRGYDIEFRMIRTDGEVRHLREIMEPVLDDRGDLVRSNGIVQDITDLKQAEEQLRQAQKMQAVGYLTGGVAHEFNNMLAVIMGNMELLEERLGDDPESHRLVDSAMETTRRGTRLTSQLLSFSRNQPLQPRLTDLDPLVADMREVLESALGETIQVKLLLAGNLGRIRIDPDQMEAAVLALAVNAHEAMPQGGTLTIETSQACVDANQVAADPELSPGAYVALALSDTGVGMPLEDVACAFDPFFTTKGMATHSGLGLSMVHGFVKQSGGFVDLRSEPGDGTKVTLCFPVSESEAKARLCAPEGEAGHLSAGERVLVVEDDPELRNVIACMLRKLGYGVSAAADGPTALSMLEGSAEFDLLFTDLILPGGINGKELAEQARSRRLGLKVLYTTGYEETALVTDDEPELAAALIRKPYRKAELAQKLRRILDA